MKRTRSIWLAPVPKLSRRVLPRTLPFVLVSFLLAFTVACTQKSPEEKVASLRTHYTAELNGFIAKPNAPAVPDLLDDEGMELDGMELDGEEESDMEEPADETDEADADADGDADADVSAIEEEELPLGPLLSNISLDIIVRHDAQENLPGITIDVTQAGPDEVEKGHFRFYLDTSNLVRGQQIQVTHVLEDVDYQEGDGFFTEVRSPVPVAERSAYQEFSP